MKICILMLVEPDAEGQPTGVIFQAGQFSQGVSPARRKYPQGQKVTQASYGNTVFPGMIAGRHIP